MLLSTGCSATVYLDWSPYPIGSQQCLDYYARQSGCDATSIYTFNYCVRIIWVLPRYSNLTSPHPQLCNNGGNWVVNIAQCIAVKDKENMKTTYGTLKAACLATGTPISFSVNEFLDAGGELVTPATPATRTTTATTTMPPTTSVSTTATTSTTSRTAEPKPATESPPSSEETQQKHGLSQSDVIAIAIGVPVGVFTIIGAIITWCMCCRGR